MEQTQNQASSSAEKLPPNSWRGLVPLQSKRDDAEKILGTPKSARGHTSVYETEKEIVDILYSAGPCKLSAVERWNVPVDTIIRIDLRPRGIILIDDLRLDNSKYPRLPASHPEHWARYMNDEDGVMIETISKNRLEQVYAITYWPRTKDKHLQCAH